MGCQLVVSTEPGGRAGGALSPPPLHRGAILVSLPGLSVLGGPSTLSHCRELVREPGSGEGMSRSFQPVLLQRSVHASPLGTCSRADQTWSNRGLGLSLPLWQPSMEAGPEFGILTLSFAADLELCPSESA